jgi:hypothetical protein
MELLTDSFFIGLLGWLAVVGGLWWAAGQSLKAPPASEDAFPDDVSSGSGKQIHEHE